MNHFTKKALLVSSLVVPFTLGAATASAAKITAWDFMVENSFSGATFAGDGVNDGFQVEEDNFLSWGSDDERSSVSINDPESPPQLLTDGDSVAGGTFEHSNQAIPVSAATLQRFDLTSTLTLSAAAPGEMIGQGPGELPAITFSSFFTETLNNGACFEGSESMPGCDDIFSLGNPEFGSMNDEGNFVYSAPSFTVDDFSYTVFLEIVGLGELTAEQCGVADAEAGCIGFLTIENSDSQFVSNFSISSSPVSVPEPGTLALLGLGLVGLGVAKRRK